jgi:signal transduction histidine kinase
MHETGEISPEMMDILKAETAKIKELSGELFGMQVDFSAGVETFSIAEMLATIEAKFSSRASSLGISFLCSFPKDDIFVKGNRKWLSRAVENLLRNAFEAVPPENGSVSLVVERQNGMVTFTVEDNGPGLSTDDSSVIFEPFYTTKREGFGLGLYIVQKVVEAHGGKVTFRSKEGKGTVFKVSIPVEVSNDVNF